MRYINLIDTSKIYGAIPNKWNNTENYNVSGFEKFYSDGWRELVTPEIDVNNQYILNEYSLIDSSPYDYFVYNVANYTPEQILQNESDRLQTEDEAHVLQLETDGQNLKRRHRERLRRRVDEGKMTQQDSKTVRQILHAAHDYLKEGDWDVAKDLAFAIIGQPNKIQNEVNWLVEKIDEYLISNLFKKL